MKCALCEEEATTRIVIHISKETWRDSQRMDLCNEHAKKLLEAMQAVVRGATK